tara:strand:- start:679 stop:1608 length:930 start_codon:yes stop_codon:yes gene_type:complete
MKKILIYRNCSLGDFIVSLPAINLIKSFNPKSKIYLASQIPVKKPHVKPSHIPLKKKLIDKFIYFNYGKINFVKFLNIIKKNNFEKIYYLNAFESKKKLIRDYLIFSILGIKNKIGFEFEKYNYQKFNETYYLCKRVKKKLNYNDFLIENFLKNTKFFSKKKFITISFGGKNILKKWSSNNWEKLVMSIIENIPNIKIYIVGSRNEYKLAEKLRIKKSKSIINLCGKTNIKKLVDVIGNSSYHISHDDGTMHIASTFQKKSVSIFGKSTAEKGRWFPLNPNLKIFFGNKVNNINLKSVKKKIIKDIKSI